MAYIDPITDEEDDKNTGKAPGTGDITTSTDSGTVNTTAGAQGAANSAGNQTVAQAPKTPNNWTNLQDYVGANQTQSGQMGQQVQNLADAQINNAGGLANTVKSSYQAPVYDTNAANAAIKAISGSDDQAIIKNAPNVSNIATSTYQGPNDATSLTGYQAANNAINNVQNTYNNLNTDPGVQATALQSAYGSPKYNLGESTLDAYILGAGQGQNNLNNIQQNANQATSTWQSTLGDIAKSIGDAKDYYSTVPTAAQGALQTAGQTVGGQLTAAQAAMNAQNTASATQYQNISTMLGSTNAAVRSQGYKAAGIDPSVGEYLSSLGWSPAQLLQSGQVGQVGNFMSQDQQDAYKLLSSIQGTGLAPTDLGATSNYSKSPFTVNSSDVSTAQQLQKEQGIIAQLVAQQQTQRDAAYKQLMAEASPVTAAQSITMSNAQIMANAKALGLDYNDYVTAIQNGIDPSKYVSKGDKATAADLGKNTDISAWEKLASSLGIKADPYKGTATQGSSFDKTSFLNALKAIKVNSQPNLATPIGDVSGDPNTGMIGQTPSTILSIPGANGKATTNISSLANNPKGVQAGTPNLTGQATMPGQLTGANINPWLLSLLNS